MTNSPLNIVKAVAVPIAMDNVDTDQIFPSRFVSKDRRDGKYSEYFLHDRRFSESGEATDFILNNPSYAGAKIIVASRNYACGSARPGAIHSHLDYGIRAVLAESFGSLFAEVAFKSGLLTLQLKKDTIAALQETLFDAPGSELSINLQEQQVQLADGRSYEFDIDHFKKRMFVEGLNEIGLTMQYLREIEMFEKNLSSNFPWLYGTGQVTGRKPI